ncbi:SIS domain-containing protein [Mycolicibacterium sp. Dal123E01]|uniref:SIS domain-containing protein n=1 Tax=Mycolicibacterium sp. Dal123E01 TaxID=3457578 RepID=UPI00403ED1ED
MTQAVPSQQDGGATILEIGQQPDVWREVAGRTDPAVNDFLRELTGRPDLRIILTGAGSSAFIGEIAAAALRRHLGRRVDAISTTSIVARPLDHLERETPTLMVSFGRSGNSPESLATTALADELVRDISHLVITCDPAGELGRAHNGRDNSRVVFMPERTNDTGFAMTSSLTSMLLTCLRLLGPATAEDGEALALAAEQLASLQPDIRALAQAKKQRFFFLGSGPLAGLARESALKMLELTAGEVVTYFDSPLGFRHGPKSALDGDTLAIVYVSNDSYTRRYDLDIVNEIRAQLGAEAVTVISGVPVPDAIVLPGIHGLDDALVALPYLVFAQYLALFTALEHGKTPDNPFPSGEVNRIVQGVTIYPMTSGA